MSDEMKDLIKKLRAHCEAWADIYLAIDSKDDLGRLDDEQGDWFCALESIVKELESDAGEH